MDLSSSNYLGKLSSVDDFPYPTSIGNEHMECLLTLLEKIILDSRTLRIFVL